MWWCMAAILAHEVETGWSEVKGMSDQEAAVVWLHFGHPMPGPHLVMEYFL